MSREEIDKLARSVMAKRTARFTADDQETLNELVAIAFADPKNPELARRITGDERFVPHAFVRDYILSGRFRTMVDIARALVAGARRESLGDAAVFAAAAGDVAALDILFAAADDDGTGGGGGGGAAVSCQSVEVAIEGAAKYGRLAVVQRIIDEDRCDLAELDQTIVMGAIRGGQAQIIGLMVRLGYAVGLSDVFVAQELGRLDMAEFLLDQMDLDDEMVEELVSHEVQVGRGDMVRLLVEKYDARPTQDNLEAAIRAGRTDMLTLLLEYAADLDERALSDVFQDTVAASDFDSARVIMQSANFHPDCAHLLWAVSKNNVNMVRFLLQDAGVDPSCNGNEPLLRAARNAGLLVYGDAVLPIVDALLRDPRVDPGAGDNEPLLLSYNRNTQNLVLKRLVADERADPAARNNELLRRARRDNRLDLVDLLLDDDRVLSSPNIAAVIFHHAVPVHWRHAIAVMPAHMLPRALEVHERVELEVVRCSNYDYASTGTTYIRKPEDFIDMVAMYEYVRAHDYVLIAPPDCMKRLEGVAAMRQRMVMPEIFASALEGVVPNRTIMRRLRSLIQNNSLD